MDCDVIIPVGPGHERIVQFAADSVQMAMDYSYGPFDSITVRVADDTRGKHGRSKARNRSVEQSTADWLYYLDADDVVTPELFLSVDQSDLEYYDALWGKFGELDENLRIHERFQTWGFNTYQQLLKVHHHYSIKIGHFIRHEVALKYPFNVEMNAGEDWEYYLRVWKKERCIKLGGPVVYLKTRGNHSTGPRSANGRDWSISVEKQLKAARKVWVTK